MKNLIRITQLVGAAIVLIATTIAFCLEILKMANVQSIELADLLLLFIYLEVMGMVGNYWSNQSVRLTYPLFIAITALSRLIILPLILLFFLSMIFCIFNLSFENQYPL